MELILGTQLIYHPNISLLRNSKSLCITTNKRSWKSKKCVPYIANLHLITITKGLNLLLPRGFFLLITTNVCAWHEKGGNVPNKYYLNTSLRYSSSYALFI